MRRVAGLREKAGTEGSAKGQEPRDSRPTASGPRMQNAEQFYALLGERRFGDSSRPVDVAEITNVLGLSRFREMTARVRDDVVRKAATTPGATLEPDRIFRAWAGLLVDDLKRQPNPPADTDSAFNEALSWGEKVLLELAAERPIVYRGTLHSTIDVIGKVGEYDPQLLLAREFAKRGELGGSAILSDALELCFVPAHLQRALGAQVATMAKVASAVPQAPAALVQTRLDDIGIIDAVMLADNAYNTELVSLRRLLGIKRQQAAVPLNLRDQVDSPLELQGTFGRLAASLSTDVDAVTRELIVMLARLQSSPEVTAAVKKVAFLGIDANLRRLAKEAAAAGTPAKTFASLGQALFGARATLAAEIQQAASKRNDPTVPKLVLASVDDLIADVFKVTGDAHFASDTMASSSDPGAILLRKVLDAPARDTLVDAALAQAKGPAQRASQVALLADKAKREAELAKVIAAAPDFRPKGANAALLLSWPTDVPRPTTDDAAKAERAKELARLGPSNLQDLIENGAGEDEIFKEFLRLGAQGKFVVGEDDNVIDETVRKVISGQVEAKKGNLFSSDTLTPLMASKAISALPAQIKAGASDAFVRESLIRAIRLQNGQLIHEAHGLRALLKHKDPKCRVKLETVLEALAHVDDKGDTSLPATSAGANRTMSAVDPFANVIFAYRVLVECGISLGLEADDIIRDAARGLLKRTGMVCLAPYANMTREENLKLLTEAPPAGVHPSSPDFLPLLDRLDLPENALVAIAARADLHAFPPEVLYEILMRAIEDKSVPTETVATLVVAATTSRSSPADDVRATNVWTTFNELAARKYDAKLGSLVLAGLANKTDIDVVYRAAACIAAEGKLFDANEVAKAVMERPAASSQTLVNELGAQAPSFFAALSLESRAKLLGRVVTALESATDASALDMAGPCFKRLAELTAAGHKPDATITRALEGIVINAVTRVAKNPLETASLAQIFADAQASGVDIEKVAKTVMTDASAKPAQSLTPGQLAAVRFEVARLLPSTDVGDLKAAIPSAKLDVGPYMAAFDLVLHRALPDDLLELVCRSAIGWAADQKAFGRVLTFRRVLADAGHADRVAVFDRALDAAMKGQPDIWSAVPEARALAAISKLEELRPEIFELARGGEGAGALARALCDRVAAAGPYAAELVPQVMSALRREVSAQRPSLDDVHVGLDVPEDAQAPTKAAAPKPPSKDFNGLELRLFQGDRSHGRVPDALPFTATPTGMNNMKRLRDALESDAPFVVCLGDPGPGKTYTSKVYAHETGSPLVELDGGPERRADEAAGAWGRDKSGMPAYARSAELEVFTKGGIIVDDEFQASRMFILQQRGEQAGRFNKTIMMRTNETEAVERHPQTKIVLIGNLLPDEIPPEIMENAKVIYFDALPIGDQVMIAQTKAPTLNPAEVELLGKMQVTVEVKNKHENLGKAIALSVRNLTRAARRAEQFRSNPELAVARAARESYIDGVIDPVVKGKLAEAFKEIFGVTPEATLSDPASIELRQGPRSVSIGEATVEHGPNKPVDPAKLTAFTGGVEVPYILGDRERVELEALAKAMQMRESTLYVAERESGVMGIIEAMGQLTGLSIATKEVTRETTVAEMFGETSVRALDDKNFETYFAPGIINQLNKANKGGIVVLRNVDRLKDATRIRLHRMLEERKIPGENGTMVDMHPNLHVIMTTSPGEHGKLGLALQNRITQRSLKAKTVEEVLERLTAMGEKLKVPAVYIADMVRFQTMWMQMRGGRIAKYVQPHNLPRPGMTRLITWLGDFAKVMRGEDRGSGDLSARLRDTLIEGGLTHYAVPDSREFDSSGQPMKPDLELLREILTAMADGEDERVLKLNGNIK